MEERTIKLSNKEDIMSSKEAIEILETVTAQIQANRADHQTIQLALTTIKSLVKDLG